MNTTKDERPFVAVRIAVMTVSDTRTRDDDTSGQILVDRLESAGHELAARAIVRDDRQSIVEQLKAWIADPSIDAVVSTGGTGLTGRDVTPEAFHDVYEKEIDGFSALVPSDQRAKDRHVDRAVARHGGRRRRHLSLRLARLARGLQGTVGTGS